MIPMYALSGGKILVFLVFILGLSLLFSLQPVHSESSSTQLNADWEDNNGLLDNLIAFWPLNETSGDAYELHTNNLTLTDINTVGSNTGHVYPLAREFINTNNEYFTIPSNTLLQTGDNVDFTIAFWCYFPGEPGVIYVAGKGNGTREYMVYYNSALDGSLSLVFYDGANYSGLGYLTPFGNTNEWHFIVMWLDQLNDQIGIQMDNGTPVTTDFNGDIGAGDSNFSIGRWGELDSNYVDGKIGPYMFWKSAPGEGGMLSTEQRTALWNEGKGLVYEIFDADEPPHLSITEVSPDPISDRTPDIAGTATDVLGAVASVEYQMDSTSGLWADCTAADGVLDEASEEFTCSVASGLADGDHSIYIRATDSEGNTTQEGTYASDTFTVDTIPPTFPIESTGAVVNIEPGSTVTVDTPRPAFVGITEPYAHVVIHIYSDPIVGEVDADEHGNWEWTPEEDIPEGTHRVVVNLTDLAGNESEYELTLVVEELADTGTKVFVGFISGLFSFTTLISGRPWALKHNKIASMATQTSSNILQ